MKKHIILFFVISLFNISCEDELNQVPISDRSAAGFFNTEEDFQQAIAGVYNALAYHPISNFHLSEVRSDNYYIPGLAGVRLWIPVSNLQRNLVTNTLMRDAWDNPYKTILRINTVLANLNPDVITDQNTLNSFEGEMKFLRAFCYFDLVRYFGGVPIIDKLVTPSEALDAGRGTVQQVYDLIEGDLKDAISKLPSSQNSTGRPTSITAKALLGKVYLTMSGPDYGISGPGLNVNKSSDALSLFNDVINSNHYSWVSDFTDIFHKNNELNGDIVFAIQFMNDGAGGNKGLGTILPTEMYHESWARVNLPFAGGVPSDGVIVPSSDMLNSFEVGDVRDSFSILRTWTDDTGAQSNQAMIIKFLDMTDIPVDRFNWGVDFPAIRYTDILMMKAEILLKSGPSAEVDAIVNQVRQRAGLAAVSNVTLDMLLEERRKEFFAEGTRMHDLIRTGKVIDVMNAYKASEDTSGVMNPMEANFIIYPIYQSQLDVKEGLYTQNPGYN